MSGWDDLEIKTSSKFLKIEEGKPQQIRLIGNAVSRIVHGFGKEEAPCEGDGCATCKSGEEPKQRFKANVYNWNLGKVQLWNFSAAIAKQLKEIALSLPPEEDMEKVDLKISVTGTKLQMRYTILPWPSTKQLPTGLALYDLEDSGIPF